MCNRFRSGTSPRPAACLRYAPPRVNVVGRDVTPGKAATESFEEVGHSSDARNLMKQYLKGTLKSA